jgi:S1-C subfamily serine protease
MRQVAIALTLVLCVAAAVESQAADAEKMSPRAWLGLRFHFEPAREGHPMAFLFIESVVSGGPAEQAGIRKQDIVVELDGKPISFNSDLEALRFFGNLRIGQKLRAKVIRNQAKRDIIMTAIALPANARSAWDANLSRATAPKPGQ